MWTDDIRIYTLGGGWTTDTTADSRVLATTDYYSAPYSLSAYEATGGQTSCIKQNVTLPPIDGTIQMDAWVKTSFYSSGSGNHRSFIKLCEGASCTEIWNTYSNQGWTKTNYLDISAYAGKNVTLNFCAYSANGWWNQIWVDNIRILVPEYEAYIPSPNQLTTDYLVPFTQSKSLYAVASLSDTKIYLSDIYQTELRNPGDYLKFTSGLLDGDKISANKPIFLAAYGAGQQFFLPAQSIATSRFISPSKVGINEIFYVNSTIFNPLALNTSTYNTTISGNLGNFTACNDAVCDNTNLKITVSEYNASTNTNVTSDETKIVSCGGATCQFTLNFNSLTNANLLGLDPGNYYTLQYTLKSPATLGRYIIPEFDVNYNATSWYYTSPI